MRTAFHAQLDKLTAMLGQMCAFAGSQIDHATQALLRANLALAEQVITDHDHLVALNHKHRRTEPHE
jgi:phosphate transport system protein